jgi:hypothetical protein
MGSEVFQAWKNPRVWNDPEELINNGWGQCQPSSMPAPKDYELLIIAT